MFSSFVRGGVLVVCFDWFSRVWFSLVLGGLGVWARFSCLWGVGCFGPVPSMWCRGVGCAWLLLAASLFGVVVCPGCSGWSSVLSCFVVVGGFRVFSVFVRVFFRVLSGLVRRVRGGVSCGCGFVFRPVALLLLCWGGCGRVGSGFFFGSSGWWSGRRAFRPLLWAGGAGVVGPAGFVWRV